MSPRDAAVTQAAISILTEHHQTEQSNANREKVYAVYASATRPAVDADDAVKVVEKAIRDHVSAKAVFHSAEASRFAAALVELEGVIQ